MIISSTKVTAFLVTSAVIAFPCQAFAPTGLPRAVSRTSVSSLQMGLFDGWRAGGSGRDRLDDEWEKQQEILKRRRAPQAEREQYFKKVEETRSEASKKQKDMWAWQTKNYKKGEDPLDEWKKRRASGQISDLDDQYGDPKKIGGIPLPGASFGVGGEFGVGGKFDNGGRFDLRLPYADQGYVDDDADIMGKIGSFFGGGKGKRKAVKEHPKTVSKKGGNKGMKLPWEQ